MEKNIEDSQVLIHFGQSLENNCVYLKSFQMWHSLVTGGHWSKWRKVAPIWLAGVWGIMNMGGKVLLVF